MTKLTASEAQAFDRFGSSVAVSGETVVVGARSEDAGGANAGAAYVFGRDQGGADNWGEVKKLTASDAQADDLFGGRVAVSGDTVVVGHMVLLSSGMVLVSGGLDAAYVFGRDQGGAGNWGEVRKLTASDAQTGDFFGASVAVSGDTAVVGAAFEDAVGSNAGAAYVFGRDQGGANNWGEVKKLTAYADGLPRSGRGKDAACESWGGRQQLLEGASKRLPPVALKKVAPFDSGFLRRSSDILTLHAPGPKSGTAIPV